MAIYINGGTVVVNGVVIELPSSQMKGKNKHK
jgi:formylmethanofuran dehydrogenase subunit C